MIIIVIDGAPPTPPTLIGQKGATSLLLVNAAPCVGRVGMFEFIH